MKAEPAGLEGSYLLTLTRIGDDRGFFARVWDEAWAAELGLDSLRNVQTNLSYKFDSKGALVKLADMLPKPTPVQALLKEPRADFPPAAGCDASERKPAR